MSTEVGAESHARQDSYTKISDNAPPKGYLDNALTVLRISASKL